MTTNPTDRRILLGMPGYGKQTSAAGRAFWRASSDMSQVVNEYSPGSLLACNFNKLWCTALNMAHRGERIDYFAMLHDDIGAEDFWLDKLIAELEEKQLDVLGVVVPIKDTRGVTSIAINHPGDNWNPECRLTMHDVYQLPETFTSDDLGGQQLLLNTGCWVVKWDQEWARRVRFTINDRIVFDRTTNAYYPEVESEDWYFSRLLNEFGLKIGATRKIAVKHEGDIEFSNTFAWGTQSFDNESHVHPRQCSPVPGAFPRDIPGWLHEDEGKALAELCSGKRVLEIGSYCGLSTVCIGRTAESVTCVDYFDGRGTVAKADTRPDFERNIERYGIADKVTVCHPDAEIPLPEYDVAFIDGAHDRDSVDADIAKALAVLKPGGLLLFHDYSNELDFEVQEAVDDFIASGAELVKTVNTLAVVRPPAAILMET
jgi:SAM-dependent methyltransferase